MATVKETDAVDALRKMQTEYIPKLVVHDGVITGPIVYVIGGADALVLAIRLVVVEVCDLRAVTAVVEEPQVARASSIEKPLEGSPDVAGSWRPVSIVLIVFQDQDLVLLEAEVLQEKPVHVQCVVDTTRQSDRSVPIQIINSDEDSSPVVDPRRKWLRGGHHACKVWRTLATEDAWSAEEADDLVVDTQLRVLGFHVLEQMHELLRRDLPVLGIHVDEVSHWDPHEFEHVEELDEVKNPGATSVERTEEPSAVLGTQSVLLVLANAAAALRPDVLHKILCDVEGRVS
mmetsp:Transcript_39215/g.107970  ORF Transcript_39215/g.107970 Transcript_39215/m.107970 type:complete len:288 (+) Transcript_39215:1032-1895(+)